MSYYRIVFINTYLNHHGTKGMHWGIKNGPPYPLKRNSGSANLSSSKIHFKFPEMSEDNRRYANRLWNNNVGIKPEFNSTSSVLSMFTNTLSSDEKEEPIVRGFLGDYLYTGINRGYEDYKIISEERIERPAGRPKGVVDDVLSSIFGWDWEDFLDD